jgi:hypothetical protein
MCVRNEADIISVNVRYHRSRGITDFFVVDNGSTDGTDVLLAELAYRLPGIRWTRDDGPFDQRALTTGLARDAVAAGVDWLVAIDADEFWFADDRGLPAIVSGAADEGIGALEVSLVTFVQDRRVLHLATDNLVTMTERIGSEGIDHALARRAVESGQASFVETRYPTKWMVRAAADLTIEVGNHAVGGTDGKSRSTAAVRCFHAPLRAREVLAAKAEQGRRWREFGVDTETAWQAQRWADLETEGTLFDEWAANSWRMTRSGAVIDGGGGPVPLVHDSRLAHAVRPFVEGDSP